LWNRGSAKAVKGMLRPEDKGEPGRFILYKEKGGACAKPDKMFCGGKTGLQHEEKRIEMSVGGERTLSSNFNYKEKKDREIL